MDNSGKPNPALPSDGKQDDGEKPQTELSHLSTDCSHHARSSRSPQPPRTVYTSSLRPTLATRPIAPAPIQTVTALNLQSTTTPTQPFISKSVCHSSAAVPAMSVPVSSSTMASIIRPPHPTIQQGPVAPTHIPHAAITTSYSSHVPRGAAAVASITPPRAAVATPIRASHAQPVSIQSSNVPRCSAIRALPVTPSIPSKITQAPLMNDPLRPRGITGGVATIQVGTGQLRPNEQIIRTAIGSVGTKPVHVSQPVVSTLQQLPEKSYYKAHLSTNMNTASSVVMPVQQHATMVSTTATAVVTAPSAHSIPLTTTQIIGSKTQLQIPPPVMSVQAVHTVPPLSTQQTQQQLVSVPAVTTKPSITIHGSPHLATNVSPAVARLTTAAPIPVAKVQPLPMTTRTNVDLNEGGNTLNLFVPSHHPTTTNQTPAAGTVGTASVVLMEAPHTLPTYIYETYQNTITMAPYGGTPTTFSTLQPGSTIRLPSHPNQNVTAAVQNASRSASVSPIMVAVEPGRSLTLHSYPSAAETIVTTCEPAVASSVPSIHAVNVSSGSYSGSQSGNCNPTSSVSSSPRPSILRKRTSEGLSVVRKNLMASMPSLEPPTSPHPDVNLNNISLSTSSPKLSDQSRENGLSGFHEDKGSASSTPIKMEPLDLAEASSVNSTSNGTFVSSETSPRKKPRKQQLTGNELVEAHSTDAEDEFEKDNRTIKKEILKHDDGVQISPVRPRPNISLIHSYRHTWKSRHNHFVHYSDVKAKEERRPNISELANQKGMLQKLNGWKIHHLSTQLDEVVDEEDGVFKRLTDFLSRLEDCDRRDNREANGVSELIKGNLQRCRIIRDQMKEAKQQVLKVIDHKPHIIDIIGKYITKKPLRKKEKF